MNLIEGNCLEKLKTISSKSVDIVITDLPYGRFEKHLEWDKPLDLKILWKELWRVSKKNTPIFMFGDMKFGVELINSCPKHFKYEIVWDKKRTTTPLLSRKRLGKSTEYVFIFYKHQPVYNYAKYHKVCELRNEKNNIKPNAIIKHYKNSKHKVYKPRLPLNVVNTPLIIGKDNMYHSQSAVYTPILPTNVISEYAVRNKKLIPNITEKPQFILEFLLKYFSNEDDTCLDCCMGSGSTGLACKNLGRKFIGIELNKKHYEIAHKRLID